MRQTSDSGCTARLRRWGYALGAAVLYAVLGFASWHWAGALFPSR